MWEFVYGLVIGALIVWAICEDRVKVNELENGPLVIWKKKAYHLVEAQKDTYSSCQTLSV